ncbi:MAG: radical SAM protein [Nitrospirae bacterium]|nr:radical SAM protein [Nitrospirota bacterium]
MPKVVCDYPWTHFEVNNPNGDVTMCCDSHEVLGNVNNQTIAEIWNGQGYRKIRHAMLTRGGRDVCYPDCAVLKGAKSYQRLDWYKELDPGLELYKNALQNAGEIKAGSLVLSSHPRWMRFAYSYVCNLNCYHCYQKDIRAQNRTLPEKFFSEIDDLLKYLQVIFYFGGEPFMYEPAKRLMANWSENKHCQHFFISNATLLKDETFTMLGKINIGLFGVSLDAAREDTYKSLRGNFWGRVMENLRKISQLKMKQEFPFFIAMTLNSQNIGEIGEFTELVLSLDAAPEIALVSNPAAGFMDSFEFQRKYLHFTRPALTDAYRQIEDSIVKIRNKGGMPDSEIIYAHQITRLKAHERIQNNLPLFLVYRNAIEPLIKRSDTIKSIARKLKTLKW